MIMWRIIPAQEDSFVQQSIFGILTDKGRQDIFYILMCLYKNCLENCDNVLMSGINWCKRENDIT